MKCLWIMRCQDPARFTVVEQHAQNDEHALPTVCARHLAQAVEHEAGVYPLVMVRAYGVPTRRR